MSPRQRIAVMRAMGVKDPKAVLRMGAEMAEVVQEVAEETGIGLENE